MAASAQHMQYLKTQIQTASREQLVLMLFDGVIRFSEKAKQALEEKELEASHSACARAQAIIMELFAGLSFTDGGEIAINLGRLYTYAMQRLVDANMKHDTSLLTEVQGIFRNLREGWAVAMEKALAESAGAGVNVELHSGDTERIAVEVGAPSAQAAPANPAASSAPAAQKAPVSPASRPNAGTYTMAGNRPRLSVQG